MAEDKIELEVVTPDRLLLSASADMVVAPGGEGNFGVLPGHAPMLSGLRPGTIDIFEGDKVVDRVFVEGGIAEVTGSRCTILAEQAVNVADLIATDAEQRLQRAREAQGADKDHVDGMDTREVMIAEAMVAAVESRR